MEFWEKHKKRSPMDNLEMNSVRVDLINVYERLKRATAMRAKALPQHIDSLAITNDDYKLVNPILINAMGELADDLGVIQFANDTPINKLSESLMRDGFIEMLSNMHKEEEDREESSEFMIHYRLPGYSKSGYRVGAVADLIYNALVQYVLRHWYQSLGLYDDMQMAAIEYGRLVQKIKNHSHKFKNKEFKRPYISL